MCVAFEIRRNYKWTHDKWSVYLSAWEEAREEWGWQSLGRGEGERSEPSRPHSSDRTRNSSRTEAGETEKERHTQRETESYTQPERVGGAHAWVWNPGPAPDRKWAGVSKPSSSSQPSPPRLCVQPLLCATFTPQPPDLALLPAEFEEGLLDRCPAPGPHPALVEGRRNSVKVEAEASRQ